MEGFSWFTVYLLIGIAFLLIGQWWLALIMFLMLPLAKNM